MSCTSTHALDCLIEEGEAELQDSDLTRTQSERVNALLQEADELLASPQESGCEAEGLRYEELEPLDIAAVSDEEDEEDEDDEDEEDEETLSRCELQLRAEEQW